MDMEQNGAPAPRRRPLYNYNVPEEDQYKDADKLTVGRLGAGFVTGTTLHGLPNIYNSLSTLKKLLWALITLGMAAALTNNMYSILHKYFSWGVSVSVDITSTNHLAFPAVTICNLNAIKQSAMDAGFEKLLKNSTYLESAYEPGSHTLGGPGLGTSRSHNDLITDIVAGYMAARSGPAKQASGHQFQDFVLACTYSGYDCRLQNQWSYVYNWKYGNCFSFNANPNRSSSTLVSQSAGPQYGLSLTLNIEQDDYFPLLSEKAGARVVIHSQTDVPFAETDGFNVPPGFSTDVGLRQTNVRRLGGIYSSCIDTAISMKAIDVFEELYPYTNYTLQGCQMTCWQRMLIEKCDCFDAKYPSSGNAFTNSETTPCSVLDATQSACVARTRTDFLNPSACASCQVPCNQTSYQLVISGASWPAAGYKTTLLHSLKDVSTVVEEIINGTLKLEENLLQVEVFYEELNYESIEESAAYTFGSLSSDVGGALGLWIGASIMSLFELLELAIDLIVFLCEKSKCFKLRVNNRNHPMAVQSIDPLPKM